MIPCLSWLFATLLLLLHTINASRSMVEYPVPTSIDSLVANELTASILNGQIYQPEVYSRAVTILENMESAPSCHRVATLTLINSCQSLEKSTSTDVALYETREEYATKLAMCELDGAKASISAQCTDFIPSAQACRKGRTGSFFRRSQQDEEISGKVCYPEVTRKQVKQCISALHSKPQWWTSYSNALQNVVVVCQASRSAIEKDEILEQFKKAVAVGNDVTEALAENIAKSRTFVSSLEVLQSRVLKDQKEEWERSRESHGIFLLRVQNSVYSMIKSFRQGTDEAAKSVSKLKQDIDESRQNVVATKAVLRDVQVDAVKYIQAIDAAHVELWEHTKHGADLVGNTLRTVNMDLPLLVLQLRTMMDDFQSSTKNLSVLHTEMGERLEQNNERLSQQEKMIGSIQILLQSLNFSSLFQSTGLILSFVVVNYIYPWLFTCLAILILIVSTFIGSTGIGQHISTPSLPLSSRILTLPFYENIFTNTNAKLFVFALFLVGLGAAAFFTTRGMRIATHQRAANLLIEEAHKTQKINRNDRYRRAQSMPLDCKRWGI